MHHEPKIPEKATHSSAASQVAMQSCCLACPSRKSNTRFGLPGFPHFFPFLDVSAITELCKSDTSSTVKAFAAPSKRINVVNVVAVKKRRVPCRVINFTKGHFSRGHFSLIVHTLLRIVSSVFFRESSSSSSSSSDFEEKSHRASLRAVRGGGGGGGGRATLSRSLPLVAFPKALFN